MVFLAGATSILGCGPVLAEESDTEPDGEDSSTAAESTGGTTGEESTTSAGTTPQPTSLPPGTASSGDSSVPPEVTTDDTSMPPDFGLPIADCWRSDQLFEAPADVRVFPEDQDGNGIDELWVVDTGGGPGSSSSAFAIGADGSILADIEISGFLFGLADIDGDGLLDLTSINFGGGGPPSFVYTRAVGPLEFDIQPIALGVDLTAASSFFFDMTSDGPADVLIGQGGGEVTLRRGDGMGDFLETSTLSLGEADGSSAFPIENTAQWFGGIERPPFGGPPDENDCEPQGYSILTAPEGQLQLLASAGLASANDYGNLVRAQTSGGGVDLFVQSCLAGSATTDIRQLSWAGPGTSTIDEFPVVSGNAWGTMFDFTGDGLVDLAYGDTPDGNIMLAPNAGDGTFGDPFDTLFSTGSVAGNDVRGADLDGDGVEELIRGLDQGGSTRLYERVYVGPCE